MNSKFIRSMAFMLCTVFSLTISAEGKWVKLTKNFDRSIPFQKLKISLPLNIHDDARIYFSTAPNDDSNDYSYYYDTAKDFLYNNGQNIKWEDMESGKLLGGQLYTFSDIMFFKGADAHASLGAIKVWVDDELTATYKQKLAEAAREKEEARQKALQEEAERKKMMEREDYKAKQWLLQTYQHEINLLKSSSENSDQSLFFSTDFNRVLKAANRVADLTDDIIGWDYNHWLMAQDWDAPQVAITDLTLSPDSAHAKASVTISDGQSKHYARVKLIRENGEWKIDDFIDVSDDGEDSEKASTIKGIKAAGYGRLLSQNAPAPRSYNDIADITVLMDKFSYAYTHNLGTDATTKYLIQKGYKKNRVMHSGMGVVTAIVYTKNCSSNEDGEAINFGKGNSSLIMIGYSTASSPNDFISYHVYNQGAAAYLKTQLTDKGFVYKGVDDLGAQVFMKGHQKVTMLVYGKSFNFELSYE